MTMKVLARMTHWGIRFVSLGVVLGFVGFAQPAVQAACNITCVAGQNGCDASAHYAYVSEITGVLDGEEHSACVYPGCASAHPPCPSPSPEDLAVLEHAASAADRAKVQSILNEHPSSLTINVERSALQQLDCGGNVVVHIPVPSTLIGDLAEGRR